jgi:glucose-6-phosphate isomerase
VTFGWGPRFLHSTGQFHKGGQPNGVFLQITGESDCDFEIPGQKFTLSTLLAAQALGDANALRSREYLLLRLNLKNRAEGISNLLASAEAL